MGTNRYKITQADVEDGTTGVCVRCGEFVSGVEPNARGYTCDTCGTPTVYGAEEALMQGLVDLKVDDEYDGVEDDDSIDDTGDGDDADPEDDGSGIDGESITNPED